MPGFTCCVPGCYSNSHRDRDLRFYTFPKDTVQREIWLKNISRAGVSGCFSTFQPTTGHRVCSIHFAGGRKTYSVRVPTLFPLRGVNERKNRRGRKGKVSATLPVITSVVSLSANAGAELTAASPEVGVDVLPSAAKVVKNGQNGQAADPAEVTVQDDGSCLAATASDLQPAAGAASAVALQPSARYTVLDLCTLGALDHPYSLNIGTTAAELLKKLNEQRDIIALLEIKMKEMKSTIRQLKVTEAKLKEEVRERDLMLSGAAVRKKV